ncbi:hypothetical protein SDC9_40318 [bioreactor metagenome]|uniref:Glycosyltransferase 2-like domain-containing protein n=1 Tax=bioreactor metagenome TaxID=1076179 RepID=A0A644VSI3_9ZZZZ
MIENAIYIFTCNRPIQLERLLKEVCYIQRKYNIYIIDDTSKRETIEENRRITNKYANTTYLGSTEYKVFYNMKGLFHDGQSLGDKTWNLGIARNFALDHSTFWKYEKVLFIDDDITGVNERILDDGFSTLTKNCFGSCTLKGLADSSIIGHIAKEIGVIEDEPKMLSGGFLFLTPASISHRFYNIYNEDWIMQLLEKEKERFILPYIVWHHVDMEVKWTLEQVIFQEPGELVVDGLLENVKAFTLDNAFWDNILEKRIKFIEKIKAGSLKEEKLYNHDICDGLLKWLRQFDGQSLQNFIEQIKNKYYGHKI